MTDDALVLQSDAPDRWDQALYAFLAEKERRSGPVRTVQSYHHTLRYFFGRLGKAPDQVVPPDVLAYAHGVGQSGKEPSAITIGARIACVSSFFKFLIRIEFLEKNPCDALERPKTPQSTPRGLTAEEVRQLCAAIPDTAVGLRDRAIILTLVLTGRRRAEMMNLTAGSIEPGEPAFYTYRGKGGKRGRRELPQPAYLAIVRALSAFGRDLPGGVSSGTVYANFQRHLRSAGLAPTGHRRADRQGFGKGLGAGTAERPVDGRLRSSHRDTGAHRPAVGRPEGGQRATECWCCAGRSRTSGWGTPTRIPPHEVARTERSGLREGI